LGWPFGQIKLSKKFEKLAEELENYYGAINAIRMNVQMAIPDKPEALLLLEQIETYDQLLYPGGIMNQPYILMRELRIVVQIRTAFSQVIVPQGK
jgi:hypothetical protein